MRVKKSRKPIEKTCIECGQLFIAYGHKALRCPECRKKVAREQIKDSKSHWLRTRKSKKATYRPPMTISEVLKELEMYNKVHGTRLSYGQFVLILEGYQ
jgi:tRNA(Ile2) C34 agmatinyltransferase TiaS